MAVKKAADTKIAAADEAVKEEKVKKTATRKTAAKKAETAPAKEEAPKAEAAPVKEETLKAEAAEKKAARGKEIVKKTAAKKAAEPKVTVTVQYQGKDIVAADVLEAAKKAFAEANPEVDIETIDLYVKPEEGTAYYAVNGRGSENDKVEL